MLAANSDILRHTVHIHQKIRCVTLQRASHDTIQIATATPSILQADFLYTSALMA